MTSYTNKNTSLSDWKRMFREECQRYGIDPAKKSELSLRHAWELGYTPSAFAETIHRYQSLPKLKVQN